MEKKMFGLALVGLLLIQEPDIDALLKQLSDETIEVREKAAASLVAMGDKAEARIRNALKKAKPGLKARFETILSLIERERRKRAGLPTLNRVTISAKNRLVPK